MVSSHLFLRGNQGSWEGESRWDVVVVDGGVDGGERERPKKEEAGDEREKICVSRF